VGLSTLDIIGYVQRAPKVDEKVKAQDVWVGAGGPATNAAITFHRLGGDARLLAGFGAGSASKIALHDLVDEGIEVIDIYADGEFPVSLVTVDSSGHRSVVSRNNVDLETRELEDQDFTGGHSVLMFDRHGFRLVENNYVSRDGVTVVADLGTWGHQSSAILRFADITVVPASGLPEAERERPADFVRRSGGSRFVVTRGAEPIVVCDGDDAVVIPVPDVSVVDTLGAGDIFVGALAFYLNRSSLLEAVSLASAKASQSCATRSARLPRLDDSCQL